MSEPVTALHGATDQTGIADIIEVPLQGMLTLRGDLSAAAVAKAVLAVTGGDIPAAGNARIDGEMGVAWMSPDELLLLCPYVDAGASVTKAQKALGTTHGLVVNVSDARASFHIKGERAREVLAKLCPVDLAPTAFSPGDFRRTRMAQVPAAFWMKDETSFQVVCFRSQARYVFDLLRVAAQAGSEVDVF